MDILLKRRVLSGHERWLIAEVDARAVPGARADRCLVCQSDQVVRRMWEYPPNWYSLSETALAALCEGTLADVPRRASELGGSRQAPTMDRDVEARL
ncbi:MAG: hypothetical protein HOQ11_00840 [Gemmatimonadaceae bacterium]|nr:hypothetical protein [Gemmatimonadaceae bacterium]NUQ92891.1 hypothetical protein [Gemmatimonadaceae bacterium]NUS95934.1 hypothetical protein [Gemmatimonadaceae bacterium]